MSAPDFYFAINGIARHIHDTYGKEVLIDYWQNLGREYYKQRTDVWRNDRAAAIAEDWRAYFLHEPGADVNIDADIAGDAVELDVRVCPAIKHMRDHHRDIVPYFCEHCDHVCGAMAEEAGYRFERTGGMGSCRQRFVAITHQGGDAAC